MTALDDCFAFPERRLLHDEALGLLRSLAWPMADTERVSLFEATGRVSAEPVRASRAIPAHTNAAVDGYAFAFDAYDANGGSLFSVAGRAAAGDGAHGGAQPGEAVRIFTGAIMPEGCDTIAMQEDCRIQDGPSVFIPGGLKRGANRRLAGEDTKEAEAVIVPGLRLRPQDIAALAASGQSDAACFRVPRVCVFSTGNEVLLPGAAFADGKVYDSNGPMLAGLFRPLGIPVTYGGILPDERRAVREAICGAARDHDLIITSGGASLGEEDHVVAALRETGALTLWQLAIKPGRPMGVGKIDSCLCFALPGNPVAVLVCALLYVWPVARRLAGEPWIEPERLIFPADFAIPSRKVGRREFFRGWLERQSEAVAVKKYGRDGSGLISSLRAASGLIEIPEDIPKIRAGDSVSFIPFSGFGIF